MSEQQDLEPIWEQAREKLLDAMGDFNRSLWDAANAAEPIALEGDAFVLGMPPGQMALGSHLNSTANGPMVRECVSKVVGRTVEVEVVEGTDPEVWDREKERRRLREEMARKQQQRQRETAGAREIWGSLYEQIGELFGTVRERRFPMVRARRFGQALLAMRDAEEKAYTEEPDAVETHEEQLNRNVARIATLSEIPETLVAVEYLRVKRMKKD
ncbi:MAG: hypothetical protein GF393_04410 [Armatimonadia bacterium]|nr:hypothetical protein [Armatimonadia bacterium]